MMFIMILLACALTFAITPMIWHLCSQIDQFKIDIKDAKEIEKLKAFIIGLKKPYHEILVLVYATFACCCLIFCIFTMKYWVLSRKIKQIVDKKIDKNLPIKANLIFYSQVILILVANGC